MEEPKGHMRTCSSIRLS